MSAPAQTGWPTDGSWVPPPQESVQPVDKRDEPLENTQWESPWPVGYWQATPTLEASSSAEPSTTTTTTAYPP